MSLDGGGTGPSHIDTVAYFIRDRLRGTVVPDTNGMDREERLRTWRALRIRVRNARLLDPAPRLDSHGFELVPIDSGITASQGVDERREAYCAEAKQVVKSLTGCNRTRMLNQVYRGGFCGLRPGEMVDPSTPETGAVTSYLERAHSDVSPWVERQLEWKLFVQGRHGAIYSVWRSTDLDRPVEHMPLAVCQKHSVAPQDMVAAWTHGLLPGGGGFLTYNMAFSAFHQWFYYPHIAPDEALVMRLYDTREETGCRRGVFHTAVQDPNAPADAKARESADIRVGAVFDEETDQDARRARFLAELPPV